MENAAEALKMAAAVLIFVLALSISINAFGEARITAKTILEYKDNQYNIDFSHVEEGQTERRVGVETIVPTIYKAYKENYKIVFETTCITEGIYQKRDEEGIIIPIYEIDLEKEVLGSDTQKEEFLMAILYGADDDTKDKFNTNLGISLNTEGIYDKIKEKTFKESLGVYYQEETEGASETPDANKTKKRVITYSDS